MAVDGDDRDRLRATGRRSATRFHRAVARWSLPVYVLAVTSTWPCRCWS